MIWAKHLSSTWVIFVQRILGSYSIWMCFIRYLHYEILVSTFHSFRGNTNLTSCTLQLTWTLFTFWIVLLFSRSSLILSLLDESFSTSEWVQATHTRNQKQQTTEPRPYVVQQRNWSQHKFDTQGCYMYDTTTSLVSKSKSKYICRWSLSWSSAKQTRSTTKHSNHD